MVWTSKDHFNTLGVDERLIEVMKEAFETYAGHYTPTISEGVRTEAKQRELVASGKSKTMNSRHLTGHAVDVVLLTPDRKTAIWTLNEYVDFARHVGSIAKRLGYPIRWGGSWGRIDQGNFRPAKFFDGPHFEIPVGF